jgi:hypothetical protein
MRFKGKRRPGLGLVLGGVFTVLVACGGRTTAEGGDDGSGGSGESGETATTGLPDHCMVETDDPAPHELTFSFTRASGDPVYLSVVCGLLYSVRSCADDYTENLPLDTACRPPCSDPDEPVACPDCALGSQMVSTDEPYEFEWSAVTFPSNGDCYDEVPAVAGLYRIVIPVYDSVNEYDEPEGPERLIEVDFELPAPAGVVEVPID